MTQAAERGELDKELWALSVDRVRLADRRPQLYGSQLDTEGGRCEPKAIEDPAHADERRKQVGVEPLAEYATQLCEVYLRSKTLKSRQYIGAEILMGGFWPRTGTGPAVDRLGACPAAIDLGSAE